MGSPTDSLETEVGRVWHVLGLFSLVVDWRRTQLGGDECLERQRDL